MTNRSIAAVLVMLLASSCGKVQESVSQYALTQLEGTTNEIYSVLYGLAPELISETLKVQEYGMTKWAGVDSTWAMLLFQDDPESSNRFVKVTYTMSKSGKPDILQFTKGALRFYWTPKNELGNSFRRMELIHEEQYRTTQP